ncbi:electron transport complex subunit RsxA [Escherichia coli]|nr:electron transport complex subunit RsxA [Escherichia coli]
MTDYLLLFVGTVLVNNFVLVKFLGLCPFMGVSKKLETAMGMGLATTFVMTLASICAWLIDTWILIPLNLIYLRTTGVYSGDCCGCAVHRDGGAQNQPGALPSAGDFLPLITTNCAVLGVALLNINLGHNFLQSALYGFSAAVGFSLVMVLFAAIRERLAVADVPAPFRGNAIALITAGLMSLAFMGFSGLVKL